jgi:ATP/maltotriose-dependent transcriptional regulator MalT
MTFPDDVTSQIAWRTVRAKVAARQGDVGRGEALAREAVTAAADTDWPHLRGGALEALAEVLFAKGQADDATAIARQAFELYEAKGSVAAAERLRARFTGLGGEPS